MWSQNPNMVVTMFHHHVSTELRTTGLRPGNAYLQYCSFTWCMMLTQFHMWNTETAYFQADNCFKENKNQTVLRYCAWLVSVCASALLMLLVSTDDLTFFLQSGHFKLVYLSFLPTGHTHNDADSATSNVAKKYPLR